MSERREITLIINDVSYTVMVEPRRTLVDVIRDGDVIVTMGAGHITAVAHELPARLAMLAPTRGAE